MKSGSFADFLIAVVSLAGVGGSLGDTLHAGRAALLGALAATVFGTPVVEAIGKLPVLGTLLSLSTETSTFPWFVAFLLWVRARFRNNSLAVQRDLSAEKDMSWKAALDQLSRKVKKQARQIAMQKKAAKLD